MKALLIRHTNSKDRADFAETGKADRSRPITDRGRTVMERVSRALVTLTGPPGPIMTSPYTRARQTAEIFHRVTGAEHDPIETDALVPSAEPQELPKWFRQNRDRIDAADNRPVVFTGHNPSLPRLVSRLLCDTSRSVVRLQKASATLITCPDALALSQGTLRWCLTPEQLQRIDASGTEKRTGTT